MEEGKTLVNEAVAAGDDPADRSFDFVGGGGATALVCEPDPALQEKIGGDLAALGYRITTPATAKEALKAMRFHVFDVVVVNERFDTEDPEANDVLRYLESMAMATRRRFFVALVGAAFRTMDNMAAFNRSVNVVIHLNSIDEIGKIVKQGVADNRAFYHVFLETQRKTGKG